MSKKNCTNAKGHAKAKKPKIKVVGEATPEARPEAPETPDQANPGKLSGLDAAVSGGRR